MYRLYHEESGEYVGHLRQQELPFYSHEPGEQQPVVPPTDFAI